MNWSGEGESDSSHPAGVLFNDSTTTGTARTDTALRRNPPVLRRLIASMVQKLGFKRDGNRRIVGLLVKMSLRACWHLRYRREVTLFISGLGDNNVFGIKRRYQFCILVPTAVILVLWLFFFFPFW
jgi:hypothetical protein